MDTKEKPIELMSWYELQYKCISQQSIIDQQKEEIERLTKERDKYKRLFVNTCEEKDALLTTIQT